MENDTSKELWIDDVMDSVKGMKRATAQKDLYAQVMERNAVAAAGATTKFPLKAWGAAAILLLAVNISSAIYATTKKRNAAATKQTGNQIALEIQSESIYNY
jgi:hypothetical protein